MFCVSVPVLSVQITVADPSASTLGRCRMSTLRLAIRCDAIASASVTVGNSPSGTLATRMPIPKRKLSQKGIFSARPITKNPTPSAVATIASVRESRTISRWSGERGCPAPCVSVAIFPSSVRMPIATTTARPRPETTCVPAKIMFVAWAGSTAALSFASRSRGAVSPVIAASTTRMWWASTSRASAGTSSPSATRITSPGTSSSAGSDCSCPPRTTFTLRGNRRDSSRSACSAFASCQNEKAPFTRMTPRIAAPSVAIP